MFQNVNITEKHVLQLVSEAVVNNGEHNEKLAGCKKDLKVNKIETDENHDNPFLTELRKIQCEHLNQLAAFCSEILEIKQALIHINASVLKQTFPCRTFQRCSNCTVMKSKSTHG